MMGKSHLRIGLGISLFTGNPVIIMSSMFGSLLPDIDTENSIISKTFKIKHLFKCKHRGFSHSLLSVGFVYTLSYIIGTPDFATGITMGYMSHIIADMCTVSGVPILYPKEKRYNIMHIKTGSFIEKVISYSILASGLFGYINKL